MAHTFWSNVVLLFAIALGIALAIVMISVVAYDSHRQTIYQDGLSRRLNVSPSERAFASERPFVSVPGHEVPDYEREFILITWALGALDPEPLWAMIADADTIIIGRHQATASRAALEDINHDGTPDNVVWLEFTFNALEYLKGTGNAQVTGVVPVFHEYDSPAEAQAAAPEALALHDTRWDDRDAILFMTDDLPPGNGTKLRLGEAGPTNDFLDDRYSIYSCCSREWLPRASSGAGAMGAPARSGGPRGSGESFYLEPPRGVEIGALSARGGTSTVTLATLRAMVAAEGGSDAYQK